ncbi:hypothetical protein CONLIGDRAFT_226279 [Coniochaeta ligniaria NRRL 30616]|uniref:Uncharacterized protein n=1 Tax=Coniochaeta ligniaria NRRL 30616 TaxID=1408157 RepID=A0A1J7I4C5_9PEZI|nr:hypothetical protein CONLIGDRAFT_226279 [Coniochaeta ligniaria NRRL 30616]
MPRVIPSEGFPLSTSSSAVAGIRAKLAKCHILPWTDTDPLHQQGQHAPMGTATIPNSAVPPRHVPDALSQPQDQLGPAAPPAAAPRVAATTPPAPPPTAPPPTATHRSSNTEPTASTTNPMADPGISPRDLEANAPKKNAREENTRKEDAPKENAPPSHPNFFRWAHDTAFVRFLMLGQLLGAPVLPILWPKFESNPVDFWDLRVMISLLIWWGVVYLLYLLCHLTKSQLYTFWKTVRGFVFQLTDKLVPMRE